jgi:hypothetical protein
MEATEPLSMNKPGEWRNAKPNKSKRQKKAFKKALKQPKTKSGKRKKREKHVNFSSSDNEVDQKEVPPDDSFVCELDQLSLSDADLNDLEELELGRTFRNEKWQDRKTI